VHRSENAAANNDLSTTDNKETSMNRITTFAGAVALAMLLGACAQLGIGGWTTLVDGTKGLENFNRVGEANWTGVDGAIQATAGGSTPAYLVTKVPYKDFQMRVEFWASDDANSGIFMRCQNPSAVNDDSCYEANIFDTRPDPTYGTGAIVKVAKLTGPMIKAGGKWNTFDITMKGSRLTVELNGTKTVDVEDTKFASGPFALQWGRGVIKFRKVEIKTL
jgi:hypothetical protein